MNLSDSLDLNKAKFGVMLKGLLHGYKPAKNVAFATGGYNMIVIGASVDGTTAYVKSVLKSDCPENVLCIGADYVFSDNYHVDLHGYIVFLPELVYLNDGGISQILHTLEKIERAMTDNSDAQNLFGPGTAAYIVGHMYKRWLNNHAAFHVFDYNKPPEGLVFDAAKFSEYGALYRQGQNNLHQESYPILFPAIKAQSVIFDMDLGQFAVEHIEHILMRCKTVNPNLKRWVHKRLAVRLFELHNSNKCPDFVCREHDDRDHQDRDVLEWPLPVEDEDPAQANEDTLVPECKQEPAKPIGAANTLPPADTLGVAHKALDNHEVLGAASTLAQVSSVGVSSLLPHHRPPLEDIGAGPGRTVMHLNLPDDATAEEVDQMAKMFHSAGVDACAPAPLPDCDEDLRLDSPKD